MRWISQWLLRLTGTAILCSAALSLIPEGNGKKSVRLVCAIVTAIAVFSCIGTWKTEDYAISAAKYRQQGQEIVREAETETGEMLRMCIEEECASYIWDKARALEMAITNIAVRAHWSEEGCWVPVSVQIEGTWQESAKEKLRVYIQGEFGIEPENMQWEIQNEMESMENMDSKE